MYEACFDPHQQTHQTYTDSYQRQTSPQADYAHI